MSREFPLKTSVLSRINGAGSMCPTCGEEETVVAMLIYCCANGLPGLCEGG